MSPLQVMAAMEGLLGVGLLLLGRWGGHDAEAMIPAWRTAEDREHMVRMYRRGSWACLGAGVLLIAMALSTLVADVFSG